VNNLPEGRRGQIMALGITFIMVVLVYLVIISPILQLYGSGAERLQSRRDMVERLQVSERALPRLRAEAARLRDPSHNGAVLLVGSSPTVAAAQLQTALKEIVEAGGSRLASSEILAPEAQDGYQKVGLHVSFSGDLTLLTSVLRGIETARPAMFVDNVEIRGGANPGEASQTLAIAFDVYGFRSL
jgi:general secretion pathway protein M